MTFPWWLLVVFFALGAGVGGFLGLRLSKSAAAKAARAGIDDEKQRLEATRGRLFDQNAEALAKVTAVKQELSEAIDRADRAERLVESEKERRKNAVAAARRLREKSSAKRGAKTTHPETGPGNHRG